MSQVSVQPTTFQVVVDDPVTVGEHRLVPLRFLTSFGIQVYFVESAVARRLAKELLSRASGLTLASEVPDGAA